MMTSLEPQIRANYEDIQTRIAMAAAQARKPASQVCTVVVSKLQTVEVIRAAYAVGIRSFGENYPQEAETKISSLTDLDQISWHMIGQIQSRKSAVIARCFQMIHSVDSLDHARKLNAALAAEQKTMAGLLEINVGGEASKAGWIVNSIEDGEILLPEISEILELSHLKIQGLMTMPPLAEQPEQNRPYFARLRKLQEFFNTQFPGSPFSVLSMGTSTDFEVAVEEGASIVRIGQAILGKRPAKD